MTNQPIVANQELYQAIYNADSTIQKAFELKYGKDAEAHASRIYGEEDYRNAAVTNLELARIEEKARKKKLWVTPLLLVPVAIGIIIFFTMLGSLLDSIFQIYLPIEVLWLTIPFSLIICSILFIKRYCNKKHKIHYNAAKENEYLANKKQEELETFLENNQHYIAVIAPEFRYPVASHELLRIFQMGRASTLPEAYDKLEQRLHQLKVEENLNKMIELQAEQLYFMSKIEYNTREILSSLEEI